MSLMSSTAQGTAPSVSPAHTSCQLHTPALAQAQRAHPPPSRVPSPRVARMLQMPRSFAAARPVATCSGVMCTHAMCNIVRTPATADCSLAAMSTFRRNSERLPLCVMVMYAGPSCAMRVTRASLSSHGCSSRVREVREGFPKRTRWGSVCCGHKPPQLQEAQPQPPKFQEITRNTTYSFSTPAVVAGGKYSKPCTERPVFHASTMAASIRIAAVRRRPVVQDPFA